jgi:tRNA-specific 2-thiouridylase
VNKKGIHLYSGGLDSMLAAKLLLDQGIELVGLHFILPFFPPDADPEESIPARRARSIGLNCRFIRCDMEFMAMAQNPPHGFGSQMNPCIDCKIFFLRKAAEVMRAENAAFVSTGEVIGQRPMSQMKSTMRHIIKETELDGYLLRPLSALKLPPTVAETEGIVDRTKLLDIAGRGRSRQMEFAARWGISDYAAPAGGCLFTDLNVARRIKDLYIHHPDYGLNDLYMLSFGRHFRLTDTTKFIVSRNERETIELEKYRDDSELFLVSDFPGPSIFVKGKADDDIIPFLVSVMVRYGKIDKDGSPRAIVYRRGIAAGQFDAHVSADDNILDTMHI